MSKRAVVVVPGQREAEQEPYVPGEPIAHTMGRTYPAPEKVSMHEEEGGTDPEPPEPPEYAGPPVPTSVQPSAGPDGSTIVITGSNFGSDEGAVMVGNEEASVVDWTDTEITAIPVLGLSVPEMQLSVTVIAADGSDATAEDTFTFSVAEASKEDDGKKKR